MKVSKYLKEYQSSGKLPESAADDPMLAFWSGWLIGNASKQNEGKPKKSVEDCLQTAIQVALFIEGQK